MYFVINYNINHIIVISEKREEGLKAVVHTIAKQREEICILKETWLGNNHDADWQNVLYVINKDPWKDRLQFIANQKEVSGLLWDEPEVEYNSDLEECLQKWCRNSEDKQYWLYTSGVSERKKYVIRYLPTSYWTAEKDDEGEVLRSQKLTAWEAKVTRGRFC